MNPVNTGATEDYIIAIGLDSSQVPSAFQASTRLNTHRSRGYAEFVGIQIVQELGWILMADLQARQCRLLINECG
jgi:hypothetical protein